MGAYIIRCEEVVKDGQGNIAEIRCTCDLETGNGTPADGRKIKGTIHWLSSRHAKDVAVMLYDKLFTLENVSDIPEDKSYQDYLNPRSLQKLTNCKVEPSLETAADGQRFQFVRLGYFIKDIRYPSTYNRIVGLKDSYKPKSDG